MAEFSIDRFVDLYAHRTSGMSASEVRALFAVASRPEVVSSGRWHAVRRRDPRGGRPRRGPSGAGRRTAWHRCSTAVARGTRGFEIGC